MLWSLLAALVFAQPPAVSPAVQPAGGELRRVPVHTVDCDSSPASQPPRVMVGTLFNGEYAYYDDQADRASVTPAGEVVLGCPCRDNKYAKTMSQYLLGNVRPRPSGSDEDTFVFLVSPPQNNGFEYMVESIDVKGQRITVTTSFWHDDIQHQWGPGPRHEGHMVKLGTLAAGDYTLEYIERDMFMSAGTATPGKYTERARKAATVLFSVAKVAPGGTWNFHTWDQAASSALIKESDLRPAAVNGGSGAAGGLWQPPVFATQREQAKVDQPASVIEIAFTKQQSFNGHQVKVQPLWDAIGRGIMIAGKDDVLVARFDTGPKVLGKYDWAEINSVQWRSPTEVVIAGSIWRRGYIYGNDKVRAVARFAVPLETRGVDASELCKNIKVTVEWAEGVDNPRNAVEEVRH